MKLPTRDEAQRLLDMRPRPEWGYWIWALATGRADGVLMTAQEFIDYLNGPDYELFLHEVEWCFINGVPRHAEPVSDWERHQANDDASDAGRHGKMILVSPSSLAAALGGPE